ncbi:MAG: hypothetical protein QXX99_05335 [Candidatus Bathyarchaeia archaeon]
MILITTSHRPTRRIRSLCNDLAYSIPGLIRVNRGKMSLIEVAEKTVQMGSDKFIVVDRWKGGPGRIRFFRITDDGFTETPPRIYISGVKLRREFNIPREWVKRKINLLFLETGEEKSLDEVEFRSSIADFFGTPMLKGGAETLGYEAYMNVAAGEDCWAVISFFCLPSKTEIGPRIKISHILWDI